MKELKVLMADSYTSKKTGKQSWKITAISEDGVIVFYAPLETYPKKGDTFRTEIRYSSYNFGYVVSYVKA